MGISVIGGSGGAASAAIGFFVLAQDANEILATLSEAYPAGDYKVTSTNNDAILDVYLLTSADELAGYTDNKSVSATAPFTKVFFLGAEQSDLIQFEQVSVASGSTSTAGFGATPFILSVPDVTLPNVDDTVTVAGGNFDANTQAVFLASDGTTELTPKAISVTNSSTLVLTRPDTFPGDYYKIKVTAPGVPIPSATQLHLSSTTVAPGIVPVWSTGTTLPAIAEGTAYSTTLVATDADGQTPLTYTLTSGTLPTGLSLSSAGVLSGTPSGLPVSPTGGISISVTVTDAVGMSATRAFTLPILIMQVFNASSTFTVPPGVSTVNYELISGGGGTSSVNSTSYSIGDGGGGAGGYISATVPVSVDDVLTVVVGAGGAGLVGTSNGWGESGGATVLSLNSVELENVAGGGPGSCWSGAPNGACGGGMRNGSPGVGSIGYNGGNNDTQYGAGGGGGMGSVGQTTSGNNGAGAGGTGVYMIDGSAVCGGGGGASSNGYYGSASFGGGAGNVNGTANTGGGGGGIRISSNQPAGKSGGSGKAIIYYEVGA